MAAISLISSIVLGALFTIFALLLSLRHVYQLIVTEEFPKLMLELFRDSYEAYVIYNFFVLLIKFAGGDMALSRFLENQRRMKHTFPINLWLPPVQPGPEFLNIIRASVLQFVLVKPAGSVLKLYAFLKWSEQVQTVIRILFYLINNVSVFLALYGLVMFYHAAHVLLQAHRPLPKFYSVKAVVFFSFWQGVAIQIAIRVGLLKDVQGVSATEQATGLQDILICFEMFIAAVAHYFVFSYKDYSVGDSESESVSIWRSFLEIFDFRDVFSDVRDRIQGGAGVGFNIELREGEGVSIINDVLDEPQGIMYGATLKRGYNQVNSSLLDSSRPGYLPHPSLELEASSDRKKVRR